VHVLLRHNRRMPRLLPACLLLAALLPGCERATPPAPAAADAFADEGSIEWQGLLACADCEAIDTRLLLQRGGSHRDYVLTETYLAGPEGARFVEHGRWRRDQALLRLQGDDGSKRVYALLPDGRLQPRDGHGRALPPRDDDFLLPVTVSDAR
jgi:hypothetical protein